MNKFFRSCLRCFKKGKNPSARIEATELNNSYTYKGTNSQANDEKINELPRQPPFKKIVTEKNVQSQRIERNFPEFSKELSSISLNSFREEITPIKIPSPKVKKNPIPEIFSPRTGQLPKVFLAVPRLKYPRSKSTQFQIEKYEEPKD